MHSPGQLKKHTKILIYLLLCLIPGLIAVGQLPIEPNISGRPASIGISGDTVDVKTKPQAGLLLAGGGGDVDAAMQWLLDRSGGGDVVIIRASGGTGYNEYLYKMGKVNSVETLLINSRELAENDTVVQIVRNAEALFIAGGDQWNYTRYWMGTKLNNEINYVINKKKAPVGGTSAGLAILGEYFFDAKNGGITSDTALTNPFHTKMSVNSGFLKTKWLTNFITDSHYTERERQGRHIVMLAKIKHQKNKNANGLGIDEATAVAIDDNGIMKVFGKGRAWFLRAGKQNPEMLQAQNPLTWDKGNQAVAVFTIKGSQDGNTGVNIQKLHKHFTRKQGWFWVENGVLKNSLQ